MRWKGVGDVREAGVPYRYGNERAFSDGKHSNVLRQPREPVL